MRGLFTPALLVAAIAAHESETPHEDHFHENAYSPNSTYDYTDADHLYYGSDMPAVPAITNAPDLNAAVDSFNTYGTIFGEHRFQEFVAATANMLIAVEAIREAVSALEERSAHLQTHVEQNESDIEENASDIEDNAAQIDANRFNLDIVDQKISYLEFGYTELEDRLAVDRATLVIMCHQYAYAAAIPDECVPIIGLASQPLPYLWAWPTDDCPMMADLPPFNNPVPVLMKETTDDTDDMTNMPHQHTYLNDHSAIHDLSTSAHLHDNGVPLGDRQEEGYVMY